MLTSTMPPLMSYHDVFLTVFPLVELLDTDGGPMLTGSYICFMIRQKAGLSNSMPTAMPGSAPVFMSGKDLGIDWTLIPVPDQHKSPRHFKSIKEAFEGGMKFADSSA